MRRRIERLHGAEHKAQVQDVVQIPIVVQTVGSTAEEEAARLTEYAQRTEQSTEAYVDVFDAELVPSGMACCFDVDGRSILSQFVAPNGQPSATWGSYAANGEFVQHTCPEQFTYLAGGLNTSASAATITKYGRLLTCLPVYPDPLSGFAQCHDTTGEFPCTVQTATLSAMHLCYHARVAVGFTGCRRADCPYGTFVVGATETTVTCRRKLDTGSVDEQFPVSAAEWIGCREDELYDVRIVADNGDRGFATEDGCLGASTIIRKHERVTLPCNLYIDDGCPYGTTACDWDQPSGEVNCECAYGMHATDAGCEISLTGDQPAAYTSALPTTLAVALNLAGLADDVVVAVTVSGPAELHADGELFLRSPDVPRQQTIAQLRDTPFSLKVSAIYGLQPVDVVITVMYSPLVYYRHVHSVLPLCPGDAPVTADCVSGAPICPGL
eukprot:NODE_807_length_1630_cov_60.447771_g797_i0.p1 GENE.NODE_807_length_1630_cov_60.447771_g797_i0~~NODE_807_length_1630_cov_60.447771_g797_i0.p1  ORF type:complete len:506 (+),score=69.79 NODE_807_length_1630_cov_60.447771_g797_i0:201-1520(+)